MAKAVKIKADIMWANLQTPNEMSGKYQVNLSNLSPAAVGALEDMGLSVSSKEGQGFYITCKSQNPIRAYDSDGNDLSNILIGNGSEAIATVSFYDWEWKNKAGRSPSLKRLVVTNLEVYGADEDEEALEVDDEIL